MKLISLVAFTIFGSLLLSGCTPDPRKAKATRLLSAAREIAQQPADKPRFEELTKAMQRIHEANLPAERNKIVSDAELGKEFFASHIERNHRIIHNFEELLTLDLGQADAECVEISISAQRAQVEMMRLMVSLFDLFLDPSVTDKETLDSKSLEIKENAKVAEKNFNDLDAEQKILCSKSKLKIN